MSFESDPTTELASFVIVSKLKIWTWLDNLASGTTWPSLTQLMSGSQFISLSASCLTWLDSTRLHMSFVRNSYLHLYVPFWNKQVEFKNLLDFKYHVKFNLIVFYLSSLFLFHPEPPASIIPIVLNPTGSTQSPNPTESLGQLAKQDMCNSVFLFSLLIYLWQGTCIWHSVFVHDPVCFASSWGSSLVKHKGLPQSDNPFRVLHATYRPVWTSCLPEPVLSGSIWAPSICMLPVSGYKEVPFSFSNLCQSWIQKLKI